MNVLKATDTSALNLSRSGFLPVKKWVEVANKRFITFWSGKVINKFLKNILHFTHSHEYHLHESVLQLIMHEEHNFVVFFTNTPCSKSVPYTLHMKDTVYVQPMCIHLNFLLLPFLWPFIFALWIVDQPFLRNDNNTNSREMMYQEQTAILGLISDTERLSLSLCLHKWQGKIKYHR